MNHNEQNNAPLPSAAQIDRLQVLINDVQRCCEEKRWHEASKFGIPYAELKCLLLFRHERYLTVKGIARTLDVAKSRVTLLVNSMFDKGLIERTDDPRDARVKLISLTLEGKRMLSSLDAFHREIHGRILAQLDSGERHKVLTALSLLKSAMDAVKGELFTP